MSIQVSTYIGETTKQQFDMEAGETRPQLDTVLRVLAPLGKTLAVVPMEKQEAQTIRSKKSGLTFGIIKTAKNAQKTEVAAISFLAHKTRSTLENTRVERVSNLAAGEGFEPSHTESESAVLPLHNPAISFVPPFLTFIAHLTTPSTQHSNTQRFFCLPPCRELYSPALFLSSCFLPRSSDFRA